MRFNGRFKPNSLRKFVKNEIQKTILKNEIYNERKWGPWEKLFFFLGKKPIRNGITLFAFFFALALSLSLIRQHFVNYLPIPISTWDSFDDWQGYIFGAQISIIAIIFPLTISLIGHLLKENEQSSIVWNVYIKYSSLYLIGVSSILLILYMSLIRYLSPYIPNYKYVAYSLTAGCWFIINLCMSTRFFYITTKVIEDGSKKELLKRYIINNSYIKEINSKLLWMASLNATRNGLITVDNNKLNVNTVKSSLTKGIEYSKKFSNERYVVDINYYRLNVFFLLLCVFHKGNKSSAYLPLTINGEGKKEHEVFIYKGNKLNWLMRLLIQSCYKFSRKKTFIVNTNNSETSTVLSFFLNDAIKAIDLDNHKLFTERLTELEEWNTEVYRYLSFKDDKGEIDSWSLLPYNIFSRSEHTDIMLGTHELIKRAIDEIPSSPSYFSHALRVYKHWFYDLKDYANKKILTSYLESSYWGWDSLLELASYQKIEKNSKIEKNVGTAILDYVGYWEGWNLVLTAANRENEISDFSFEYTLRHLEITAKHAVSAFKKGQKESTEWAVDIITNWLNNFNFDNYIDKEYFWSCNFINHTNYYKNDENEELWDAILGNDEYDLNAAKNIAIKNAWTDIRIILAAYFLDLSVKGNDFDMDFIKKIALSLLSNKRLKPSGESVERSESLTSSDVLSIYVRHRCIAGNYLSPYNQWLERILEEFNRVDLPQSVSGRIYMSSRAVGVEHLWESYLYLISMTASHGWHKEKLKAIYKATHIGHREREHLVRVLDLFDSGSPSDELDISKSEIFLIKDKIKSLSDEIRSYNNDVIASQPEDQSKLDEIAERIDKSVFEKESGITPISLFENVNKQVTRDNGYLHKISILNFEKARIAEHTTYQKASNEEDFFSRIFKEGVKDHVYRILLNHQSVATIELNDKQSIIERIYKDIDQLKKSNVSPVLFTLDSDISLKLQRDMHGLEKKYNVKHVDGYGENYYLHFNGAPTYSVALRGKVSALLTSEENLKQIVFYKDENNKLINADYESKDEEIIGSLVLSFRLKVKLGNSDLITYSLDSTE